MNDIPDVDQMQKDLDKLHTKFKKLVKNEKARRLLNEIVNLECDLEKECNI